MIALTHVVVIVALHGVLRDVADEVGRHGYVILFMLIAAESFAFPLPGEVASWSAPTRPSAASSACTG